MKIIVRLAKKITLLSGVFVVGVCNAEGFYVGAGYGGLEAQTEYYFIDDQNNMSVQLGYAISPTFAFEALYSRSLSGNAPGYYAAGNYRNVFWERLVNTNPGMTIEEAQAEYPNPQGWTRFSQDLTYEATAAFGVLRTSGNPYIKTRIGFSMVESTAKYRPDFFEGEMVADDGSVVYGVLDNTEEGFDVYGSRNRHTEKKKDTEFSMGFGAGYQLSPKLFAELEFTRFNKNAEYYSVSLNYHF
jgi:hypothetical protein